MPDIAIENYARTVHHLPVIRGSSFAGKPVPERQWIVPEVIPAETVTLLNGDGGVGKSLLALQLAVASATGQKWIGMQPTPGAAIYLTAEDSIDEIHRRLDDIRFELSLSLEDLDRLHLISLAGEDALLAVPGEKNVLEATDLFTKLEADVREIQPNLVVLDTLADLFGGSENDRAQARQFIGQLRGLAMHNQTTVLLLAHPSLSGISSGSGSSGSTAWNNSVRSRLYLDRCRDEQGFELDPQARVLRTMKANYAGTGNEIALRWQAGAFVRIDSGQSLTDTIASTAKADRVFLSLLRAYDEEGRPVTSTPSANYAPAVFARDPRSEGVKKRALTAAMNRLFAARKVEMIEYGPPSRRRKRLSLRLAETEECAA